mmetsp:Transcript_8469/g.26100  ORF Transcript_8469/g.26100 Transcript_8469/m.26100 type:complete len:651 (-) Transcript_8469:394-2346(-)
MSIQKTDDDYVERRTDSVSPYSFFGDSNGTFNTRTLQEGPYVITATPEDQNGDYGEALSVAFRLEDQEVAVTRFVLMDAENQLEIEDDVQDGQVFALDDLETQKLSVKVETTGSVRYVSMNLNDGYKMRSEFSKPYSPFGRSGTKVRSGLQPGEFTLEATPYDQEDHPGASRTVSFTVVPSAEQTLEVGHCSGRDVIKKIRDTQGDVFANAMDEAVIDQKCLDLHKANTVYLVSDNTTETPQILPSDEGVDVAFLDQFFDGRTHLNTETDSDDAKLMDTAVWIKEAYEQFAQTHVIAQPNLKQFNKGFDLDDVSENEQTAEQNFNCEIPAIMCCWTRDRQAGDNNGNCRTPYDERCVDADPMDNTDMCVVRDVTCHCVCRRRRRLIARACSSVSSLVSEPFAGISTHVGTCTQLLRRRAALADVLPHRERLQLLRPRRRGRRRGRRPLPRLHHTPRRTPQRRKRLRGQQPLLRLPVRPPLLARLRRVRRRRPHVRLRRTDAHGLPRRLHRTRRRRRLLLHPRRPGRRHPRADEPRRQLPQLRRQPPQQRPLLQVRRLLRRRRRRQVRHRAPPRRHRRQRRLQLPQDPRRRLRRGHRAQLRPVSFSSDHKKDLVLPFLDRPHAGERPRSARPRIIIFQERLLPSLLLPSPD